MSYETTVLLMVLVVATSLSALLARRIVHSLVLLFCSSLLIGAVLITYDAFFAGLFHIVTFAGAVSVLLMIMLMLTGGNPEGPRRSLEAKQLVAPVLAAAACIVVIGIWMSWTPYPLRVDEPSSIASLPAQIQDSRAFLWNLRPWDLFFVSILISAGVLGVVNLFVKRGSEGE